MVIINDFEEKDNKRLRELLLNKTVQIDNVALDEEGNIGELTIILDDWRVLSFSAHSELRDYEPYSFICGYFDTDKDQDEFLKEED